jgi:hypothetical protein
MLQQAKAAVSGGLSRLTGAFFYGKSRKGEPHWSKVKNPNGPAVKLEAEEDWGR